MKFSRSATCDGLRTTREVSSLLLLESSRNLLASCWSNLAFAPPQTPVRGLSGEELRGCCGQASSARAWLKPAESSPGRETGRAMPTAACKGNATKCGSSLFVAM